MFPIISAQLQNLFKDCLGFARQLSQSPGLYCRVEVKLEENSFTFQTGSPGKFSGKRKSHRNYRSDQRRQKPPGKGIPIPGNHGVGSVAPGDPTRAKKGIVSRAPSSPPCSRIVPWSRNLFSTLNIPQLDRAGSFISEKNTRYPSINPLCCAPGAA